VAFDEKELLKHDTAASQWDAGDHSDYGNHSEQKQYLAQAFLKDPKRKRFCCHGGVP
jgi:hypothetical protein